MRSAAHVLAKLDRAMPNAVGRLAGGRQTPSTNSGDDSYGEVEYAYANRSDISRSTSPLEILPLLYAWRGSARLHLPGRRLSRLSAGANGQVVLIWFFCGLPFCIDSRMVAEPRLPEPITARFTRRFSHEHEYNQTGQALRSSDLRCWQYLPCHSRRQRSTSPTKRVDAA